MRPHDDKKFKPDPKPFKENKVTSLYRVVDQIDQTYYAKFFLQRKLIELNIFESSEYNQTVLSDLSDQMFQEHFLEIKYTYSIPEGFIFVTDTYEASLDNYLKNRVIQEKQALKIFQQVIKAAYSLYMAGFWHRNIRPEHFVKVGAIWKMESLVFNEHYKDADGAESEYIWNPSYQPPQAYEKEDFSEEELDQMIVWNLGSLLVDMLLSHHKLKDKTVLDKFAGKPFSFRAIGVKKQFSKQTCELLAKMLHHDPKQRMTITQMFSNEYISREVARLSKKGQPRKGKIYIAGQSHLSKSLAMSSDRAQEILTVKGFKKDKQKMEKDLSNKVAKKNSQKLQSQNQILKTIKNLTKQDLQTISQYSQEEQSLATSRTINQDKKIQQLMTNPRLRGALEAYKCYYDKCQLLLISIGKLQNLKDIENVQAILLNKYAVTFVSMMSLHRLAESMNRNLNYLQLDPELWSEFQQSNQFRGFKEIVNFRRHERKNLLNPLRQRIMTLKQNQRKLLTIQQISDFIHCNYKITKFEQIKAPFRKILKYSYDIVTKQYNKKKTIELARLGMYITYCMTIDKLYIPTDIPENFTHYFKWMNLPIKHYVPIVEFQEYLDNADKKTLVSHSIYILRKYFSKTQNGYQTHQSRYREQHI